MRVIICDDEKSVLDKYSKKLESLKSKSDLPIEIETYDSGEKLLFNIEDRPADIVYMDIGMPGMDGIAAAKKIRKINSNCELLFLTDHTEKWDIAFDLEARNYLIKDRIDDEKFEQVFLKAVKAVYAKEAETVIFSRAGEFRNIAIDKIKYFEVNRKIVTVHYDDSEFEFYSPFSKIEENFLPKGFIKVHRSYIVQKSFIYRIIDNNLQLTSGEEVPISKAQKKVVMEFLGKLG